MTFDALTEAEAKAKLIELTAKLDRIKANQKRYYEKKKDYICQRNRNTYNENKENILARRRELYNGSTERRQKRRDAYLRYKAARQQAAAP